MTFAAFDCVRLLVNDRGVRSELYLSPQSYERMKEGGTMDFLVMCYGCPSHPFDHSAALMGAYLSSGLVLVYPNYIGTWASEGTCTLENAVDTASHVREMLVQGSAREIRHDKAVSWTCGSIVVFGGSFGGSVALVAAAKDRFNGAIAVSPVVDWALHGREGIEEEDLSKTYKVIADGYGPLWRVDEATYDLLRTGALDLSPARYVDQLAKVPTLIVHAADDRQVSNHRSVELSRQLAKTSADHAGIFPESGGHLILYHMGQADFAETILAWLRNSVLTQGLVS